MKVEITTFSTRLWVIVCSLLALLVAAEWQLGSTPTDAPDRPRGTADLPVSRPPRYTPPALADFPEALDRPVFFADRKLPPRSVEAAPVAAALDLELEGVAMIGERRVALLRQRKDRQAVQLEEGTEHNGWTLKSVTAAAATFERGSEVTELALVADAQRR